MAHRRNFSLQNQCFQLEEVVNYIIAEEDDNAYDFLIVPPDPGEITDEEEGPEDDLVTQALPAAIVASGNPIWRKTLPIYSTPHEVNNAIEERLNNLYNDIKDCSPVILFEKLFDQQMCNLIVEQSILYAGQNNRHGFQLDIESLKGF
ncbi:hypothetical protein HHI36_009917 [Cryptolaemus montrouzieri]|uniref:PiggyBac transposable element-derived protein domain-containing protein n=1 Tax=Cryptolaemus montrouzieri TaxID=559131 RepID=A0ABD2MH77_9CUCU